MLRRKHIPIEQYRNSTQKDDYECFYENDDDLKGDVDNERIIENGNDFLKCEFLHDRVST